jgi:hypothetical protein
LPYRLAIALCAVTFGIIHNIFGFGKYFFRYFFIRLYFFQYAGLSHLKTLNKSA